MPKTLKQEKCPRTDECIKKEWYMSTMAYYSVMKKNEPIPIAATCMKVAVIIPSDVSQKKKDISHIGGI